MRAAPLSGTVTLLLTDIEGSTRLARELGERWIEVLARHHRILEAAIAEHDGTIDGTDGDAFFAIFESAAGGIAAAAAAQRRLYQESWPDQPVRVRMGLHTGDVRRAATGYVGIEIHRAARIAASAGGGQVLLSHTAHAAAGDGHAAQDLGVHRLKDFPEGERLFHLVVDGRTADQFPAPRTLPVRPTNVPVLETALIGRSEELAAVTEGLADGVRLLTVVGPGGSGKTRLAVAAAEELLDAFPGGAWLIGLADVFDREGMLSVIAEKLAVAESPGRSTLESLVGRLETDPTLLVLDNLEQLRHASGVISELLGGARASKVLATSQAPLRLPAEHVVSLRPLAPSDGRQLFVETARTRRDLDADASASAIDAICERLDGLPLAIELAASRTSILSPEELLGRLSQSLELLEVRGSAKPERGRSLRAAISWTFELLSEQDRELCADLALFATAFSVADAEALAQLDVLEGLEELLEFSFLRRVDTGGSETRFEMAQTLRDFGRAQLEDTGRLESARRRHADWALTLAEECAAQSPSDPVAASDRLWRRLDDVYSALGWAIDHDPTLHLRLCATIPDALVWLPRGSELDRHLDAAIAAEPPDGGDLARALSALGFVRSGRGDNRAAVELLQRSAAMWRDLGDLSREADALTGAAFPALALAPEAARAVAEQALASAGELADQMRIDRCVAVLAQLDVATGHSDRAEPLVAAALEEVEDPQTLVWLRHIWADCALIGGDPRVAMARYAAALRGLPALEVSPGVIVELQGLAMSLARAGHAEEALETDRIAAAFADHFNAHPRVAFWEELLETNIGLARAAAPGYVAAHPLEDLDAARDWALSLADALGASG
ncbi:MAG TPA: adenylate/guanylate cyclase domain-containing protein [Solirubrobacteraceae bacterium]|nr:adenylate/guanylate cyclase domain-containing protein [Solirubrobacteraceae bacterium]